MADKCLEGCLMISLHQYTPLLLGACLIHNLQSVPTLEKMTGKIKNTLLLSGIGHILYPPYTKAALPTGKLSPSSGRQAGG